GGHGRLISETRLSPPQVRASGRETNTVGQYERRVARLGGEELGAGCVHDDDEILVGLSDRAPYKARRAILAYVAERRHQRDWRFRAAHLLRDTSLTLLPPQRRASSDHDQ